MVSEGGKFFQTGKPYNNNSLMFVLIFQYADVLFRFSRFWTKI